MLYVKRALTVRYVRRDRNHNRHLDLLHLRRKRKDTPLGGEASTQYIAA